MKINRVRAAGWFLLVLFLHLNLVQMVMANEGQGVESGLVKPVAQTIAHTKSNQGPSCSAGYYSPRHLKKLIYFLVAIGTVAAIFSKINSNSEPRKHFIHKDWSENPCRPYGNPIEPEVSSLWTQIKDVYSKSEPTKTVVQLPELPTSEDFRCEMKYLNYGFPSEVIQIDQKFLGNELDLSTGKYKEVDKIIKNICQKAQEANGMSQEQCLAVINYTFNAYSKLNADLSTPARSSTRGWAYEALLSQALQKLPSYEGWVTRVDYSLTAEEAQKLFHVGKTILFPAFTSSSKVKHTSNDLEHVPDEVQDLLEAEWKGSKVIFKILSKTARDIEALSVFGSEKEALFLNNAVFKVLGAHRTEDRLIVTLEEIPNKQKADVRLQRR